MKIKQKGAGLVEVLVTLFILSVGLLGIAGLQATGIQAGHGASLRTTGLLIVEDITSRMKANRKGVYDITADAMSYNATTADMGNDNQCADKIGNINAVICTPANMARHDILLWKSSLAGLLPSGATADITSVVTNSATIPKSKGLVTVTINVNWTERGTARTYVSVFKVIGL